MPRSVRKSVKPLKAAGVCGYFGRVLQRHCEGNPENRLAAAVIVQAFSDTQNQTERAERLDAGRFFVDGRMEAFAAAAGLSPDFVRSLCHGAYKYRAAHP